MFIGIVGLAFSALRSDIVLADFEGRDYGSWQATGSAFGVAPAEGTLPGQMAVTGFKGHGLANSFVGGDDTQGTLTSPDFTINRKFLAFLIGGGGWEGKTCMNLIVEGRIVRTAVGPNVIPGGSEALAPNSWDLQKLQGRTAHIEIVDHATGGWAHINVDQIVLTDRTPPRPRIPMRTLTLQKRYLNFPVQNGAPVRRVSVKSGHKVVREFEIKLAEGKPDFWVFIDASSLKGKTVELKSNGGELKTINQSDAVPNSKSLYVEPLRPQFHFSSRVGWLNDPNGLVYSNGEYHLYYQHNPYGWDWGNMHWGHAVSKDLVHWQELPIALYPYRFGDWAYSGSAIEDTHNTAGFRTSKANVIVAAYTSTDRGECIVYSNDHGRTFTEYSGNPVVKHAGRDPRLFWYEPGQHWVMAVYDEQAPEPQQGISFYTSPDLKQWTFQSRIGGFFECPDIFELPVDGDKNNRLWVLTAANSEYQLGHFDGKTFSPITEKLPGHLGDAYYAAQTFSNMPASDPRRIRIGWCTIATPGMPFNQMMSFPSELTLRTTPAGVRMFWQPVKEISNLYGQNIVSHGVELLPGQAVKPEVNGDLFDVNLTLDVKAAKSIIVQMKGVSLSYDTVAQTLSCNGKTHPVPLVAGKVELRILVDRTSLEIYGQRGELYMPMTGHFVPSATPLTIEAVGGAALIDKLQIHELKSAWR